MCSPSSRGQSLPSSRKPPSITGAKTKVNDKISGKSENMAEFKEKRNEKGEYLTIAEFAERAGVSKQAVYQRLNKGLKEYSRVVDGVKMLDLRALEELYGKEPEQGIEQEIDKDSKVNSQENQDVIKALLEQLNVKDQQIADLNARLADEQRNHGRTQLLLIEREHQLQMIEDQRKEQEERKSQEETFDLFRDEDYQHRNEEKPRKWWQFWK
jgi:predicted DNA-binding protein YlxM (UPF0122 family)